MARRFTDSPLGPDAHSLPRREERRRRDNTKRGKYARVKATIQKDNIIEINTHYVRRLTLYSNDQNDQMVNLAHPITIVTNGSVTYEGIIPPTVRTLFPAGCGKTILAR